VNNAMILGEDDQKTFTTSLQLQQLYQSLTVLASSVHTLKRWLKSNC